MRPGADSPALPLGLLAGLVLLALPLWPESPEAANRKLEGQIEELEDRLARVEEKARANEAKYIQSDAQVSDLRGRVEQVAPAKSQWVSLRSGGGTKFRLQNGEDASVKVLGAGEHGGVQLQIVHKTLRTDVVMHPGEELVAIDDLGTEKRVYTTRLLTLRRDRTGAPVEALISVDFEVQMGF